MPEDSRSLQLGICKISEDDEVMGKANTPGIPWEPPEEYVQFGGNVCGRGPAFFRCESGGGREKDSVCSLLWIPTDGQMMEIPTDMQTTGLGDQRYVSLGGVYSGSVQPGRTGA